MTTAMEQPDAMPAARLQTPCLDHRVPLLLACLAAAEIEVEERRAPMSVAGRMCAELAGASPRPGLRFGGTAPVPPPAAAVAAEPEPMPGQAPAFVPVQPAAAPVQAAASPAASAVPPVPPAPMAAEAPSAPVDEPGDPGAPQDPVPAEEDWPEGDGLDAVVADAAQAMAKLKKEQFGVPRGGR